MFEPYSYTSCQSIIQNFDQKMRCNASPWFFYYEDRNEWMNESTKEFWELKKQQQKSNHQKLNRFRLLTTFRRTISPATWWHQCWIVEFQRKHFSAQIRSISIASTVSGDDATRSFAIVTQCSYVNTWKSFGEITIPITTWIERTTANAQSKLHC